MYADPEHRWDIAMMTVKEALASGKGKATKAAMDEEIKSLISNRTWELVERPRGVNTMKNRWEFMTKYHVDDTVTREKACLVVKGFTRVYGADYNETYAPVGSYVTLRIFLSIGAVLDLHLMQLDMKNAFLQSKQDLPRTEHSGNGLHVHTPGFEPETALIPSRLLKRRHRLRLQAAEEPLRAEADAAAMVKGARRRADWQELEEEPCQRGSLLQGRRRRIDVLGARLRLRPARYQHQPRNAEGAEGAAGGRLQAAQDQAGREVSRAGNRARQVGKEAVASPASLQLTFDDEEAQSREEEEYRYKVGLLQFVATTTRSDIDFACRKLGSGLTVRGDNHWREVDRCLHYLADSRDAALEFGSGPESMCLVSYADDDDAGDKHNKTSMGGSSSEGSQSLGRASRSNLLDAGKPTVLHVDNQSAITLAEGLGLKGNLKHMERRYA
ncbi:unnamed protein product [Closterium sp. NIES-53]